MNPLAHKVLIFCRDLNLGAGHIVPEKPFRFTFWDSLNPKERAEIDGAFDELVASGFLEERTVRTGSVPYALTQEGVNHIYDPAFDKALTPAGASMTVQNFNFHGTSHNIQIGDNNTQQIVSAIKMLAEEIDRAAISAEAKAEAKGKLQALLENPVVSGLLSGVGTEMLKGLIGV